MVKMYINKYYAVLSLPPNTVDTGFPYEDYRRLGVFDKVRRH
jgi:hypothetical protein